MVERKSVTVGQTTTMDGDCEPTPRFRLMAAMLVLNLPLPLALLLIARGHPQTGIWISVSLAGILYGMFWMLGCGWEVKLAFGFYSTAVCVSAMIYLPQWLELASGEVVTVGSVSEFVLHPEARGFVFTDGRILGSNIGCSEAVYQGDNPDWRTVNWYWCAPLVNKRWRNGDKVAVWMVGHVQKSVHRSAGAPAFDPKAHAELSAIRNAAICVVDLDMQERYLEAARNSPLWAQRDSDGPLFVQLVDDPQAEIQWVLVKGVISPLLANVLLLGLWWIVENRREPKGE